MVGIDLVSLAGKLEDICADPLADSIKTTMTSIPTFLYRFIC